MKRILSLGSILLTITFMTACTSNSDSNLLSMESLTEGSWISYDGEPADNEAMVTAEAIEYDSTKNYQINQSSYVSYFNGDEFIKTVKYSGEEPMTLETVDEADQIQISFNKKDEDAIELKEAE